MTNPYIQSLIALHQQHADPEKAREMKRYMKGQYEYFGIQAPQRRALLKQFLAEQGLPPASELQSIVRTLWAAPQRELQYVAVELLIRFKKSWTPEWLPLFETLITAKSWWDTVDFISSDLVGELFRRFPEQIRPTTARWMDSGNMWLQRTALIFQRRYKHQTDRELLFDYCTRCAGSKEFFIRKAIGWALREYAKTDPAAVVAFVKSHKLSPLSEREAVRRIKDEG